MVTLRPRARMAMQKTGLWGLYSREFLKNKLSHSHTTMQIETVLCMFLAQASAMPGTPS